MYRYEIYKKRKKIRLFLFFLILPALIIYSGIAVFPIFNSMFFSLYTGDGLVPDQFVGIENFVKLFSDYPYKERMLNAFLNTIEFFIFTTVFTNFGGFVIALLVTRKFHGSTFFRRITFVPAIISIIIIGYIFRLLFSPSIGFINDILEFMRLGFLIRPWLIDETINLPVIAMISAWQFVGVAVILYAAGIDGINSELLEAASIDGASELQKITHIIIPLLIPVFRIVMILNFVGTFTGFEVVYAIAGTEAKPNFSLDVFGSLFYRTTFGSPAAGGWGVGMGAALAAVIFVIVSLGVLLWMRIFRSKLD